MAKRKQFTNRERAALTKFVENVSNAHYEFDDAYDDHLNKVSDLTENIRFQDMPRQVQRPIRSFLKRYNKALDAVFQIREELDEFGDRLDQKYLRGDY
jgi:DNA repair ATPase RecN